MRLKKYIDGSEYIIGGIASIEPNGIEPIEEYDLSDFNKEEIEELNKNKKNKKLLRKARRI